MSGAEEREELERLRAENAALDEQVKLLVQTEQRFYRSQNALDHQMVRIERLAAFALESSAVQTPAQVLERALGVIEDVFDLDWTGAIELLAGPGRGAEVVVARGAGRMARESVALPADAHSWLATLSEPQFASIDASGADGGARALVRALDPGTATVARAGGGLVVLVPVGNLGEGRRGLLAAFSVGGRPLLMRPGAGSEHLRPYLQLLANHVEHAIANVELNARLREQRDQLERSLATLERTQQQLVQAQKMDAIGRLAGGVAHDFNNLLTVILGYAGALSASLPHGAPQQENVVRVLEAARRAADITSQLLALGRRQMRRPENLDLSGQTARTADLLARLVGEDVRVELDLQGDLPPVRADRSQLEQVLLNLVINARDAMPSGGRLHIATRRAVLADAARCGSGTDATRFGVLEVTDEGVGMDAATREQAFEPFFTTKESGQSSGLGLAVVYGIVTQSEGHVLVDSEPGRGTRFTVLLPFAPAGGPVATPSTPQPGVLRTVRSGSVLVVEDEAALREVVRVTLARAGHRVFVASHGEEALELLAAAAPLPDLVLTDVMMPRLGGLALAEQVAQRWPGLRVAFMSGYSEDLIARTPRGERSFLAKPFTPADLLAFVGAQLHASR